MRGDVEEIKTRLNIVDILGEYLRLNKAGANWKALCPFHNEKTPSFMVSEERQSWHCFGCGKGGDIFSFVMEIEGLEFPEVMKNLAERAGVKISSYNPQKAEQKNRTLEILELATKFYEHQLWKGPGEKRILPYLRGRGLKDETIKKFRLGYAPRGWQHMFDFLKGRGYNPEEIMRTGLLVQKTQTKNSKFKIKNSGYYDRFRDRIMFPISDYAGKVIGYSARVAPGGDESQARYVNTPETEVYHKSLALYGLNQAKQAVKKNDSVLLVEGNMDAIAACQAGIENVVAVSGTALTENQLAILKRYTSNVAMCFDMDSAGEAATRKSLELCFSKDMRVRVVQLPDGKDAAELAKSSSDKLKKAVERATPAIDYVIKNSVSKYDKNTAEGKRKISDEILAMVASLASEIEKGHWIKKISETLGVAERALTDALRTITLKKSVETSRGAVSPPEAKIAVREKLAVLIDELIGAILSSPEFWRLVIESKRAFDFPKDSLLAKALEEGERCAFDFGKFAKTLNDQEEAVRADRLYFQKRYRLDTRNNLEEVILSDPAKNFHELMNEIQREQKRKYLERITKDLKLAEERKDREAAGLLLKESQRIISDLTRLESSV